MRNSTRVATKLISIILLHAFCLTQAGFAAPYMQNLRQQTTQAKNTSRTIAAALGIPVEQIVVGRFIPIKEGIILEQGYRIKNPEKDVYEILESRMLTPGISIRTQRLDHSDGQAILRGLNLIKDGWEYAPTITAEQIGILCDKVKNNSDLAYTLELYDQQLELLAIALTEPEGSPIKRAVTSLVEILISKIEERINTDVLTISRRERGVLKERIALRNRRYRDYYIERLKYFRAVRVLHLIVQKDTELKDNGNIDGILGPLSKQANRFDAAKDLLQHFYSPYAIKNILRFVKGRNIDNATIHERAEEVKDILNRCGFNLENRRDVDYIVRCTTSYPAEGEAAAAGDEEDVPEDIARKVIEMFNQFKTDGFEATWENCTVTKIPSGRINKTYFLRDKNHPEKPYIVQDLHFIFNPQAVEHNLQLLEKAQESAETQGAFKQNGVLEGWTKVRYYNVKGHEAQRKKIKYEYDKATTEKPKSAWRVMEFVDGQKYEKFDEVAATQFKEGKITKEQYIAYRLKAATLVGEAIAKFRILMGFIPKGALLAYPLPGFHDHPGYVKEFEELLKPDKEKNGTHLRPGPENETPLIQIIPDIRTGPFKERIDRMIEIFEKVKPLFFSLEGLDKVPAHNDLKINNVLFEVDPLTGEPLYVKCFIDLDAIQMGTAGDDIGDGGRSVINPVGEEPWRDGKALKDVQADLSIAERLINGYLDKIANVYGQEEADKLRLYLYMAIAVYCFELGTRFLICGICERVTPDDEGRLRLLGPYFQLSEEDYLRIPDKNLSLAEVQYKAGIEFLRKCPQARAGIDISNIPEPIGRKPISAPVVSLDHMDKFGVPKKNEVRVASRNGKRDVKTMALPKGKRIVAVEVERGEMDIFAGDLLRKLENNGNTIIRIPYRHLVSISAKPLITGKTIGPKETLEITLRTIRPDIVLSPHTEDVRQEAQDIRDVVVVALQHLSDTSGEEKITIEYESIGVINQANLVYPITDEEMIQKKRIMAIHKSQMRRVHYDLATAAACQANMEKVHILVTPKIERNYAELFSKITIKNGQIIRNNGETFIVGHEHKNVIETAKNNGVNLSYYPYPKNSAIVFLGPHYDDMEIAASAILKTFQEEEGNDVYSYVMVTGHRASILEIDTRIDLTPEEKIKQKIDLREKESREAAKEMAIKPPIFLRMSFYDHTDPDTGDRVTTEEQREVIYRELEKRYHEFLGKQKEIQSEENAKFIVYLPKEGDLHPDHRATYELGMDAVKRLSEEKRCEIEVLFYVDPWAGRFNLWNYVSDDGYRDKEEKYLTLDPSAFAVMAASSRTNAIVGTELSATEGFGGGRRSPLQLGGVHAERFNVSEILPSAAAQAVGIGIAAEGTLQRLRENFKNIYKQSRFNKQPLEINSRVGNIIYVGMQDKTELAFALLASKISSQPTTSWPVFILVENEGVKDRLITRLPFIAPNNIIATSSFEEDTKDNKKYAVYKAIENIIIERMAESIKEINYYSSTEQTSLPQESMNMVEYITGVTFNQNPVPKNPDMAQLFQILKQMGLKLGDISPADENTWKAALALAEAV